MAALEVDWFEVRNTISGFLAALNWPPSIETGVTKGVRTRVEAHICRVTRSTTLPEDAGMKLGNGSLPVFSSCRDESEGMIGE